MIYGEYTVSDSYKFCGRLANLNCKDIFVEARRVIRSMKKQEINKRPLPKECHQDQPIHPCGSTEFCPEDPEKCIFFKGGLR